MDLQTHSLQVQGTVGGLELGGIQRDWCSDLGHLGYNPDRYVRVMDRRWDEKAGMA